ncbi:DNA (cytosine-5-)-methyltransferase [Azospirillum sp.]|uniref:DNA (cytosine-5-)-methyltransferase n=1 Tax=Azospirillum sp. TaxID=34012 RepID=UPI0026038894|nr:DNA (cytosine-5-)-methyltransferase [Azospirillum sp.]
MVSDIRSERLKRKIAQKAFAKALGIPVTELSKWERGLVPIKQVDFKALSREFACNDEDLRCAQEMHLVCATPGEGYTTAVHDEVRVFERVTLPVKNKPKVLDLFCGAGGFSFGLESTGHFQVTGGIDILPDRIDTFRANHRLATAICGDIRFYPIKALADLALHPEVIIGGAPCQGFSSIRPFRNLTENDPRNSLFEQFVLAVAAMRPEWCIFENVVGLLTHQGGVVLDSLLVALKEVGYRADWRVINAAHYGLPQNRERLIIVGSRDGAEFPWPIPTHFSDNRSMAGKRAKIIPANPLFQRLKPAVTVIDAIGDLPPISAGGAASQYAETANETDYARLMRGNCSHLTLHESTAHSGKMMEIIRLAGSNRSALPAHMTSSGFSSSYSRLDADKPSVTLTVNFVHPASNKCIHPFQDRALTPREGARIQGFPDSFEFCGSRAQIVKQIGNAVPPLLGRVIGKALATAMDARASELLEAV